MAVLGPARHGELPEHVVLHEREDLVEILVLVVVGVDVDDQHVVEVALVRLLPRMAEELGGVHLVD